MFKFKIIIFTLFIGYCNLLFSQVDTLKKSKKHNFEFNILTGVNAFNRIQPNYRDPLWKNVGFFSNFYFSIKANKNFKIKKNYYFGIAANLIYFENYSQYTIGSEKDISSFYLKSDYYINNKLLFMSLNFRKNWQLKNRFTGFSSINFNSNVFSETKSNGSTVYYNNGQYNFDPRPYAIGGRPIRNNGWFKINSLKSNLMFGLMIGLKSKFNKTPICFTLGTNYGNYFPLIMMSKYSIVLGVTLDL